MTDTSAKSTNFLHCLDYFGDAVVQTRLTISFMSRCHTPHLLLKASTESVPPSPMRWLHCGQRTALVLLFLLSNDRMLFPLVAATFRGAKPKPIPSLSKDGHIVEEQITGGVASRMHEEEVNHISAESMQKSSLLLCAGPQQQVILEKIAPGKGVRRMKGGLLPWWVRKRLQEKGSPTDASLASSTNSIRLYQSGSRSKAKTLNKDVQVSQGLIMSCSMRMYKKVLVQSML